MILIQVLKKDTDSFLGRRLGSESCKAARGAAASREVVREMTPKSNSFIYKLLN
jgi:hypothetical protein